MKLKIGGIIFEISFPLAAVMTCVIIFDSSLSVIACALSVLVHESGHLLMLHRYGSMPDRIRLTLFDIAISDRRKHLRSFGQELTVTLAGVAANLITGAAALAVNSIYPTAVGELLINSSFTLAFFNILPAHTLDGGQALMLILSKKLDPRKAMLIQDIATVAVIIPLGVLGFMVLLRSRYNFTLLITAVYLLAVLILKK